MSAPAAVPTTTAHRAADTLARDAYAVAWARGLSSVEWRIVDEEGRETLTAKRDRDPVRSLLWGAMLVVALFGAGGGALIAAVGSHTLTVGMILFLASFGVVLALAPVVAFRLPRPIVVRDAQTGASMLTIHRRTRFGVASLRYETLTPAGEPLGRLRHEPVRHLLRTAWRIECKAGAPPIRLTEPTPAAAIGARVLQLSLLLHMAERAWRSIRRALAPRRSGRTALHAVAEDFAAPLAQCVWDDSGDWLWIHFTPATPPADRWLILAACMLAVAQENA